MLSMEAGGLGSWEWDIKRDRVFWSPQTERMHGLAEGTFSGSREEFASYIHPDDRDASPSEIARTLETRRPTYHIKYRFIRKDGAVRWLEGFARLRTDEHGEPESFLGVSHDVTEREELLEGEQQARRDAEAANAAKAIFLTTMSHELRTPLNAVSGYVDLLEMGVRGPVTDLQREDLRRIRRASQHLLVLINDILNYARLEAGTVELHFVGCPRRRRAVRDGGADCAAASGKGRGVRVPAMRSEHSRARRPREARSDPAQPRRERGEVHGWRRTNYAELRRVQMASRASSSRIPGRGIPRGKHSPSSTRSCRSTAISRLSGSRASGSGLAISRDLARAMHGDISVQSDAGKGATFVLTLPLATADEPSRISGEVERVL